MIGTVTASVLLLSLLIVRDKHQSLILVTAFGVRLLVSVVHIAGVALPDSQFDARTFEHLAWIWARDRRWFDDFTTGSYFYSWLSSGIYVLVGRDPFILHVINSYFGVLTIYFVMRSAQRLLPASPLDRASGWILTLYPSIVLYSVLTLREAPMILSMSISIYLLISWVVTRRIIFGWGSISFMMVAQLFHSGMIGGTLAVILIYSRLSIQSVTVRDNLRPFALVALLGCTLGLLLFSLRTGVGLEKFAGLVRDFDISIVALRLFKTSTGRGAYLSGVEIDAWWDLIWNIPLRVLYFLGSPFFWMASQFRDVIGLLDGLVFLFITFRVTLDVTKRRFLTIPVYFSLALIIAGILTLFALGTSNYGTAFRHRAKVFPWLMLLYLYGSAIGPVPSIGRRLLYAGRRQRHDPSQSTETDSAHT